MTILTCLPSQLRSRALVAADAILDRDDGSARENALDAAARLISFDGIFPWDEDSSNALGSLVECLAGIREAACLAPAERRALHVATRDVYATLPLLCGHILSIDSGA